MIIKRVAPESGKYYDIEYGMYEYVKKLQPRNVIELGYGRQGHTTVSLAYVVSEYSGTIYSYDLQSPEFIIANLKERNLDTYCNLIQGNVNTTYLKNPKSFDLVYIDLDNTWELIHDIVIKNKFINTEIKNGANVLIEGGADAHPRINRNTLEIFHNNLKHKIFDFEHIAGRRTSLSKLILL